MLDFKKLVLEAITSPAGIMDFWNDPTELINIKKIFKTKFNLENWTITGSDRGLLVDAFERNNASKIKSLIKYFPIIDFLFYIAEEEDKSKKRGTSAKILSNAPVLDKTKTDQYENAFITEFQNKNPRLVDNSNPVYDYKAISGKGTSLLQVLMRDSAKNIIGEIALDNFKDKNIKETLYGILNNHRKLKTTLLNKVVPDAGTFIEKILSTPQNFIGGQTTIPNNFKQLYNEVSLKEIVELCISIHNFYESELIRFNITKPRIPVSSFNQFITNTPLNDKKLFNFQWTIQGKLTQPVNTPAETSPGKQDPGINGYIIANIKNVNTPESQVLIRKFENLLNFIKAGEPQDWTGALQSLASVRGILGKHVMG